MSEVRFHSSYARMTMVLLGAVVAASLIAVAITNFFVSPSPRSQADVTAQPDIVVQNLQRYQDPDSQLWSLNFTLKNQGSAGVQGNFANTVYLNGKRLDTVPAFAGGPTTGTLPAGGSTPTISVPLDDAVGADPSQPLTVVADSLDTDTPMVDGQWDYSSILTKQGFSDNMVAESDETNNRAATASDPALQPANLPQNGHCIQGKFLFNNWCADAVSAASAVCSGASTSLLSDPNNCGACGTVCPDAQSCVAGQCQATTQVVFLTLKHTKSQATTASHGFAVDALHIEPGNVPADPKLTNAYEARISNGATTATATFAVNHTPMVETYASSGKNIQSVTADTISIPIALPYSSSATTIDVYNQSNGQKVYSIPLANYISGPISDFSLSSSDASVQAGGSGTASITVAPLFSASSPALVTLGAVDITTDPYHAVTLTPPSTPVTPGKTAIALPIATTSNTTVGAHQVLVYGTDASSHYHQQTLNVMVTAVPPPPQFSFTISDPVFSPTANLPELSDGTISVHVAMTNHSDQVVTIFPQVATTPNTPSIAFSPAQTLTADGDLQFTMHAPLGSHGQRLIYITGYYGSQFGGKTVGPYYYTVTPAPSVQMGQPATVSVAPGQSGSISIPITITGGATSVVVTPYGCSFPISPASITMTTSGNAVFTVSLPASWASNPGPGDYSCREVDATSPAIAQYLHVNATLHVPAPPPPPTSAFTVNPLTIAPAQLLSGSNGKLSVGVNLSILDRTVASFSGVVSDTPSSGVDPITANPVTIAVPQYNRFDALLTGSTTLAIPVNSVGAHMLTITITENMNDGSIGGSKTVSANVTVTQTPLHFSYTVGQPPAGPFILADPTPTVRIALPVTMQHQTTETVEVGAEAASSSVIVSDPVQLTNSGTAQITLRRSASAQNEAVDVKFWHRRVGDSTKTYLSTIIHVAVTGSYAVQFGKPTPSSVTIAQGGTPATITVPVTMTNRTTETPTVFAYQSASPNTTAWPVFINAHATDQTSPAAIQLTQSGTATFSLGTSGQYYDNPGIVTTSLGQYRIRFTDGNNTLGEVVVTVTPPPPPFSYTVGSASPRSVRFTNAQSSATVSLPVTITNRTNEFVSVSLVMNDPHLSVDAPKEIRLTQTGTAVFTVHGHGGPYDYLPILFWVSKNSDQGKIVDTIAGSITEPIIDPPSPPQSLSAVSRSSTMIIMQWTAPTSGQPTAYRVYRSSSPGELDPYFLKNFASDISKCQGGGANVLCWVPWSGTLRDIPGTVATLEDRVITNELQYYYGVIAMNGSGANEQVSDFSNILKVPPPAGTPPVVFNGIHPWKVPDADAIWLECLSTSPGPARNAVRAFHTDLNGANSANCTKAWANGDRVAFVCYGSHDPYYNQPRKFYCQTTTVTPPIAISKAVKACGSVSRSSDCPTQ